MLIELLLIVLEHLCGLGLVPEQAAQMLQVALKAGKVCLGRKHFYRHTGTADLQQNRSRTHFFSADQHIRFQAQDTFCRELALIADTGQRLE